MMNEFLRCLTGKWSNKTQAMSNPTKYAWILISWTPVGDGKYLTKQWYHYAGETDPYREKLYSFKEDESTITMMNWNLDGTRNEKCDTIVRLNNGIWQGQNRGMGCIVRGATLKSEFSLTKNKLITRDGGYIDGKRVWGSPDFYHFGRLTQR